jgi:membrane associated rhomboid family serine protease
MLERFSVTHVLIFVNVVVFGLQRWIGSELLPLFALWPVEESPYNEGVLFRPWQLLTHGFLHGDGTLEVGLLHLFFNMYGLYMIGPAIEALFGPRRYLGYYLICIVGAAVVHLTVNAAIDFPYVPTVGASGGLFGLLLAFGVAFPKDKVWLLVWFPAWLFVAIYAVVSLYLGITQTLRGIAHFAHLGGMLTGLVMMALWRQHVREGLRKLAEARAQYDASKQTGA